MIKLKDDQILKLEKLFRVVFRNIRQEVNKLLGEDINSNEFIVLKTIAHHNAIMASMISKELNVSASHITSVTEVLVKKGYILRQSSRTDRRVVVFVLTESGDSLVKELEKRKSSYLKSKFIHFSDSELEQFIMLFEKLNDS